MWLRVKCSTRGSNHTWGSAAAHSRRGRRSIRPLRAHACSSNARTASGAAVPKCAMSRKVRCSVSDVGVSAESGLMHSVVTTVVNARLCHSARRICSSDWQSSCLPKKSVEQRCIPGQQLYRGLFARCALQKRAATSPVPDSCNSQACVSHLLRKRWGCDLRLLKLRSSCLGRALPGQPYALFAAKQSRPEKSVS